jgi:signal transduction histidine kinase
LTTRLAALFGRRLTLRSAYLFFTVGAVFAATLAIGFVNYLWIERLTLQRAVSRLEAQAQLILPQIDAAYQRLTTDVQTVSRMPPFKGLARSIPNGDIDPRDGSTSEHWRNRLATIFRSIMAARPEYLSMTYVGLADGHRELVRVDRQPDGTLQAEADGALRQQGARPYLEAARALPDGDVHLSAITGDRPDDALAPHKSALRAITPVHDAQGEVFGFLVISANYDLLLKRVLRHVESAADLYVISSGGDYIRRAPDGRISDLVRHSEDMSDVPAPVAAVLRNGGRHAAVRTLHEGDLLVSVAHLALDARTGRSVTVVLAEPQHQVLADAYETRVWVLLLSGSIVVIASLLAFVISGRLTRPLHDIATSLQDYDPESGDLPLPADRNDEIGEISRAFAGLIERKRRLREAQVEANERLVRSEKMASLGNLVAGMAHELTTPMGAAVTVASTMDNQAREFEAATEAGQLRKSDLRTFIAAQRDGAATLLRVLGRAAEQIAHFKQVAADQASEKRRGFALDGYLDELVDSIRPSLKRSAVVLALDLDSGLILDSFPGPLGQVVINLVNNAVLHGFPEDRSGTVTIRTRAADDRTATLEIRDDGAGMEADVLKRIFDPFFTTKWGSGGTGLGMSIVHNIVTEVLGGSVEADSTPGQGATIRVTIPTEAPRWPASVSDDLETGDDPAVDRAA